MAARRGKPKHWRIQQPGDLVEIDTKEIRMRRGIISETFQRSRCGLALGTRCRRIIAPLPYAATPEFESNVNGGRTGTNICQLARSFVESCRILEVVFIRQIPIIFGEFSVID
jgi:hypothetical protein